MSLNSTVTLMTLREPDVEKEQPPMNSSRTSMVEAKDGSGITVDFRKVHGEPVLNAIRISRM